jgi:lysophospholipid acyltransferase (LPLAT)-like uncharacterized protein
MTRVAWFIIQTLSRTLWISRPGYERVVRMRRGGARILYAFFHGEQFPLVFAHRHTGLVIMSSLSRDGELQARILRKFGYDIVRGSTRRGFTSGTLAMHDKLVTGREVALAVDGPKGPAFRVKPGVVYLAQKTGALVVPVRVVVRRCIELHNWDRYRLPLPFSAAEIRYGEPMAVGPGDSIHRATADLEHAMRELAG